MRRRPRVLLFAFCCAGICCEVAAGEESQPPTRDAVFTAMNPGIGRIPMAPVPYERPTPQYPHRLEIRPTTPPHLIIPSVIFRPPSEVLRHFEELRATPSADPAPRDAANVPPIAPGAPVPTVKTRDTSTADPAASPEPRPTRRQALGW